MIWQLVRREHYFKLLLWGGAVVVALVLIDAQGTIVPMTMMAMVAAGTLKLGVRGSRFELALPISGRDLYLARALGLQALAWLPACALWLRGQREDWGMHQVAMVSGLSFGLQLSQSLWPERASVSQRWAAAGIILSFGVAAGLSAIPNPEWVVAGFLAATIFLFFRTLVAIPPSFQIAPHDSAGEARSWRLTPDFTGLWMPAVRSFPWWTAIFIFLSVLFQGVLGITGAAAGVFPAVIFTLQASAQSRAKSRWMVGLPFSARIFLAQTLLSVTVPSMLALGIGLALPTPTPDREVLFSGPRDRVERPRPLDIDVPLAFWRRAPGGAAPQIVAPWGETATPSIVKPLGMTLYNPYSLGVTNSRSFHEWQFTRATEAVLGRSFTPEEYARAGSEAKAGVLASRRARAIASFFILWLQGVLLCWMELSGSRWLNRVGPKLRHSVIGAPMIAGFIAFLGGVLYKFSSGFDLVTASFETCLLYAVSLPWSTWALCAFGTIPFIGLLAVLDWQFRRSEAFGLRSIIRVASR